MIGVPLVSFVLSAVIAIVPICVAFRYVRSAAGRIALVAIGLVLHFLLSGWLFHIVARLAYPPIDIAGGDQCWLVPEAARNIFAKGSRRAFAAEFEITEQAFADHCRSQAWALEEICRPVPVDTFRNFADDNQQHRQITVVEGLVHDSRSHRGGVQLVFDRAVRKGYLNYAGW
jgi:hypothetical protein